MTDAMGPGRARVGAVPADLVGSLRVVKDLKTRTVRHGGDPDLGPMLELRRGGVTLHIAVLDGEPDRVLSLMHDLVVLSDADQVVVFTDTYTLRVDPDDAADAPLDVDEVAGRFAAGDTSVRESLTLLSVTADGASAAIQINYRRRRRRIDWGTTSMLEVEEGGFVHALRSGFTDQAHRRRLGPAPRAQEVANLLRCALLAVELKPPPRNKPCPCGSGRRAKHCCWGTGR